MGPTSEQFVASGVAHDDGLGGRYEQHFVFYRFAPVKNDSVLI